MGNTQLRSQKIITTTGYKAAGYKITVMKSSWPQEKLKKSSYEALRMKAPVFVKIAEVKSVVHKTRSIKNGAPLDKFRIGRYKCSIWVKESDKPIHKQWKNLQELELERKPIEPSKGTKPETGSFR